MDKDTNGIVREECSIGADVSWSFMDCIDFA